MERYLRIGKALGVIPASAVGLALLVYSISTFGLAGLFIGPILATVAGFGLLWLIAVGWLPAIIGFSALLVNGPAGALKAFGRLHAREGAEERAAQHHEPGLARRGPSLGWSIGLTVRLVIF
jgi:hypothetical protein